MVLQHPISLTTYIEVFVVLAMPEETLSIMAGKSYSYPFNAWYIVAIESWQIAYNYGFLPNIEYSSQYRIL